MRSSDDARPCPQKPRMTPGGRFQFSAVAAVLAVCLSAAVTAQGPSAKSRYDAAMARDAQVRAALDKADPKAATSSLVAQVAQAATAFEAVVRRYPTSGYADNALWQGASLAEEAYQKLGRAADRARALRLYEWLIKEYPHSPLVKRAKARMAPLAETRVAAESPPAPRPVAAGEPAVLKSIQRTVLPDAVRVTLELDREVAYREEKLAGPARVFFDLNNVQPDPALADTVLTYPSDAVSKIRVGRHPDNVVRVVLDLENVARYSVFTLYSPFRLVIDSERAAAASASAREPAPLAPLAPIAPTAPIPPPVPDKPAPAAANAAGGFSMARQLGLGVSRIVIDPGHGGHDPGALGKGLNEAELVLDVALRLEKLLSTQPGLEVVLTRRTNVYIPLEERTAIANRESADLFLSIHANASRNTAARGIETYFLSFASSPEAEAVAARENSASAREMHQLPDIIKAIALNNKLDESRDLAAMVQESLITRLRRSNKNVRNLGVKKAPFVVLIGAQMPSVLAEISFVTNKQDLQLLKTPAYKQRIAEALEAAVLRYRRSLKGSAATSE